MAVMLMWPQGGPDNPRGVEIAIGKDAEAAMEIATKRLLDVPRREPLVVRLFGEVEDQVHWINQTR